jgi:XPA protein C-terminus
MQALPYEINEYIIRYMLKGIDVKKLKEIVFTNKYFYNTVKTYIKQRYNIDRIHDFIMMNYTVCIKCYSRNCDFTFNNYYCEYCLKTLKLITLTDAKNHYFLKDEDLNILNFIEKRNLYRRSMSMFLFLEEQVEALAIKKHTFDGLLQLHEKRLDRKNRKIEIESEKNQRKQEITEKFNNTYDMRHIQALFVYDLVEKYINKNIPKLEKRKIELFEYMKNNLDIMIQREEFLKAQKEEELKNKIIKRDMKIKHQKDTKCGEISCNKIGSIKCISKKCKNCCDGFNCERHNTVEAPNKI